MPIKSRNIDELKVENGKLIKEVSASRLDTILEGCNARIIKIDARITEFEAEKVEVQATITQVNQLKGELIK